MKKRVPYASRSERDVRTYTVTNSHDIPHPPRRDQLIFELNILSTTGRFPLPRVTPKGIKAGKRIFLETLRRRNYR